MKLCQGTSVLIRWLVVTLLLVSTTGGQVWAEAPPVAVGSSSAEYPPPARILRLTADPWYPFNALRDGAEPGYFIELARDILRPHGIVVRYEIRPWGRAILDARDNKADCVVGATQREASDFQFASQSWTSVTYGFYVRANDPWHFNGVRSLGGRRVVAMSDYDYENGFVEFARENLQQEVLFRSSDDALDVSIRQLGAGLVDTVLEASVVMQARLNQLQLDKQIVLAGTLPEPSALFIACAPHVTDVVDLMRLLDEGFVERQRNGRLAELQQRYGVQP